MEVTTEIRNSECKGLMRETSLIALWKLEGSCVIENEEIRGLRGWRRGWCQIMYNMVSQTICGERLYSYIQNKTKQNILLVLLSKMHMHIELHTTHCVISDYTTWSIYWQWNKFTDHICICHSTAK